MEQALRLKEQQLRVGGTPIGVPVSHPYALLLGRRDVVPRFAAVFLSAVPLGMMALAVVLSVRAWTGSYAAAGALSGLFSFGNALGLLCQGRLIDRVGARPIVAIAGAVCAVALAVFVVAGRAGAPLGLLGPVIGIAGAAVPGITAAVRAWLPRALEEERLRSASYALLAVLFQAAIAIGPLVVSVAILLGPASLAIAVAAVIVVAATLLFVLVARADAPPDRPKTTLGAARIRISRGMMTVLGVAAAAGLASGVLQVALPAIASSAGLPALAGAVFAAIAVGDGLGALLYGARTWHVPRWRQLAAVTVCAALIYVAAATASALPLLLLPVMLLVGMLNAPLAILPSAMLDDVADASAVARGYTLLISTGLVTTALGSSGAGALADLGSPRALLLLPVAVLLAAACWVHARRGTLGERQRESADCPPR